MIKLPQFASIQLVGILRSLYTVHWVYRWLQVFSTHSSTIGSTPEVETNGARQVRAQVTSTNRFGLLFGPTRNCRSISISQQESRPCRFIWQTQNGKSAAQTMDLESGKWSKEQNRTGAYWQRHVRHFNVRFKTEVQFSIFNQMEK